MKLTSSTPFSDVALSEGHTEKRVIPVIIGTDILKALNKLDGTLAWYNLGFDSMIHLLLNSSQLLFSC
ncbi:predicted protein [Plenodomus lingam JN3]|uniref:Predicted protein n=1 Tax=Leptosphaeria maculans (strain JN3 / isolate v23.1.3 / race Av1-4-5-6-7-8) TaxID=985895 RepID=E4ZZR4_LEPMJ|nr:predicted protein [Plenodomus lingam JN3]CBX96774.1 predicted protein [Plenodomus lingam JN3]